MLYSMFYYSTLECIIIIYYSILIYTYINGCKRVNKCDIYRRITYCTRRGHDSWGQGECWQGVGREGWTGSGDLDARVEVEAGGRLLDDLLHRVVALHREVNLSHVILQARDARCAARRNVLAVPPHGGRARPGRSRPGRCSSEYGQMSSLVTAVNTKLIAYTGVSPGTR